jgi:hypothetical protein
MRKYIITVLLFIGLALIPGQLAERGNSVFAEFASSSVSVTGGSVLPGFFREPFETVVFIFRDGSFLTFSTSDSTRVGVPISWVVESIEGTGRAVSDSILCVHNHFIPVGFSPVDRESDSYLRGKGFRGVFGIYYTTNGKFREIEEGTKR